MMLDKVLKLENVVNSVSSLRAHVCVVEEEKIKVTVSHIHTHTSSINPCQGKTKGNCLFFVYSGVQSTKHYILFFFF
jgi:hypothetical protein